MPDPAGRALSRVLQRWFVGLIIGCGVCLGTGQAVIIVGLVRLATSHDHLYLTSSQTLAWWILLGAGTALGIAGLVAGALLLRAEGAGEATDA